MRPVQFTSSTPSDASSAMRWLVDAIREIELASHEDIAEVSDKFSVSDTYTPTYSINPASASITDVANVLATLLADMKRRGRSRGT